MQLGIGVGDGRPFHSQTHGKDERFHRTLQAETLLGRSFRDLGHCQQAFDRFRTLYNLERPDQALDYDTPVSRYRLSPRPFPEQLPPIEYGPDDIVRMVQAQGVISVHGHAYWVGKAFRGLPVALGPTTKDRVLDVLFLTINIARIDLTNHD